MDATRTWLIRLATVTGVGMLALAVYNALRTHQLACGPYRGACDLPLLSYLWRPPVIWEPRPDSGTSRRAAGLRRTPLV